jgi:hypothetical protein
VARSGGTALQPLGELLEFQTFEPEEADKIDQTGQVANPLAMLKHCLTVVNP